MRLLLYRTPTGVLLVREDFAPTAADRASVQVVDAFAVLETRRLNKDLQETIVDGFEGRASLHLAESTARCLLDSIGQGFPDYPLVNRSEQDDRPGLALG